MILFEHELRIVFSQKLDIMESQLRMSNQTSDTGSGGHILVFFSFLIHLCCVQDAKLMDLFV